MCGQQFLYSRTATHARVFQLRCRSWTCEHCRPRRQKRLRFQALSGRPVTFLTLTANPQKFETPGDAARAMTKAWRAARRAIEAYYGGDKAEYLTVVESTKRGWPHLHVLTTRRWIDQRYLSALWDRLTGAPIVHIERVRDQNRAAGYVAKYLGKAPHKYLNCKRYYMTRHYVKKPTNRPEPFDWSTATTETLNGRADYFVAALLQSGHRIVSSSDEFFILEHPPPAVFSLPGGATGTR